MDKKELRKILLKKRRSIPKEEKIIKDKKITEKITALPCFERAEQVLLFASTEEEFDTRYLAEICKEKNKAVFYPRCLDKKGIMEFFRVNEECELVMGKFNIKEPPLTNEKYIKKENDLIIVPALSIDKRHYRIGYGGGYYDRFLKDFNGVSLCPCYSEMCTDRLPTNEYDIKVSIVATDKEVFL